MRGNNLKQEVVWLLNEKYGGRLTDRAKKDINRLKKGEPVDYVIGHKNFCGCKIDLRYKPLIPRDETEGWMSVALGSCLSRNARPLQRRARSYPRQNSVYDRTEHFACGCPLEATHNRLYNMHCLDMFAGSGCCGIAVLKNVPNSYCDFCDIDDNCLKQIRFNLKLNGINKNRYRIIKSDVFSSINYKLLTNNYNLILANPPYVGLGEKNKVQKSVLDFEPKQALFAKDSGLYFIKKFLSQAKNHLAPDGVIYLEIGYNQKKEVAKLLKKFNYSNFEFHKDQFNKWRFVKIFNRSF